MIKEIYYNQMYITKNGDIRYRTSKRKIMSDVEGVKLSKIVAEIDKVDTKSLSVESK